MGPDGPVYSGVSTGISADGETGGGGGGLCEHAFGGGGGRLGPRCCARGGDGGGGRIGDEVVGVGSDMQHGGVDEGSARGCEARCDGGGGGVAMMLAGNSCQSMESVVRPPTAAEANAQRMRRLSVASGVLARISRSATLTRGCLVFPSPCSSPMREKPALLAFGCALCVVACCARDEVFVVLGHCGECVRAEVGGGGRVSSSKSSPWTVGAPRESTADAIILHGDR